MKTRTEMINEKGEIIMATTVQYAENKFTTLSDVMEELSSDISKNAEDLEELSDYVNKYRDDIEDVSNTIIKMEERSIIRDKNTKEYIKLIAEYERYKLFCLIYNIAYSSGLLLYALGLLFIDGTVSNVFYHLIFAVFISINFISCFVYGYKSSETLTNINKK